jgi:hypothetical protein
VFKFLLRLEDGEPNDPAVFVTAVPNWTVGETFSTGRGHEWRILAIETDIDEELVERGINAVFTVEGVSRRRARSRVRSGLSVGNRGRRGG